MNVQSFNHLTECSQLALAVVVDAGGLGLSVVKEEVGVGPGSGGRCDGEGSEVSGVLVNSEAALVVEHHGAKEKGTGSGHDHAVVFLFTSDKTGVLGVEFVGWLIHNEIYLF